MLSSNWANSFIYTNLYANKKHYNTIHYFFSLQKYYFEIAFFVMYSEIVFCDLVQISTDTRVCTQNCANMSQNRCFYRLSLSLIIYIYIIITNNQRERVRGKTNSYHETNLSQRFLISIAYLSVKKSRVLEPSKRGKEVFEYPTSRNTRAVMRNCQTENKKVFLDQCLTTIFRMC